MIESELNGEHYTESLKEKAAWKKGSRKMLEGKANFQVLSSYFQKKHREMRSRHLERFGESLDILAGFRVLICPVK